MPRKATIEVDGRRHEVVEHLGFTHEIGAYAAVVLVDGQERVARRRPDGQWRFHTAADRVRPLVEHIERCARDGRDPFGAPGTSVRGS